MLSLFRACLKGFKGIDATPDLPSAQEELGSFLLDPAYPVYLCVEEERVLGYMILKIDGVVWVEQIFVKESSRRKKVGSLLYQKAEEVSKSNGGDTLFNYVHPNNHAMIEFLRSKGYSVLNLIEIRKPFKGEKVEGTVQVGDHTFDY